MSPPVTAAFIYKGGARTPIAAAEVLQLRHRPLAADFGPTANFGALSLRCLAASRYR